jgi:NADH:ubiquinone reductase (H+-translocating)
MTTNTPSSHYHIVILGAGYAGLMAALRLGKAEGKLGRVALINAEDAFVERVRLQETVARSIATRIPSISTLLADSGVEFIRGSVAAFDAEAHCIRVAEPTQQRALTFDRAVYALGSRTDVETVPGVAEHAYRLDPGDGPRSAAALRATLAENARRHLRVTIVGGAETAIEAAGEIKATWPQTEVTMISRTTCASFKGPRIARDLRRTLENLGIRLVDGESVIEVGANTLVTASGKALACDVCVWSAGLRASALAREARLATDQRGRIFVDPTLRSISHPQIFAVGDAAHPIAPTGAPYRISVFAALTSGAYVADAILSGKSATDLVPFSYSTFGQGIAIGRLGVGFPTYPNDQPWPLVLSGRVGFHTRNLFVRLTIVLLTYERKHPGFFFWFGRRRVSWQQANDAMRKVQVQPA